MSESVHEPVIDAPMARRIDSNGRRRVGRRAGPSDGLPAPVPLSSTPGWRLSSALGLGALVVVLSDTDHTTQVVAQAVVGLSTPTARRTRAPAQIAAHVSERLPQLPDGQQLVGRDRRSAARRLQPARGQHPDPAPRGGRPAGPSRPAVRSRNREVEVVDTASGVQYVLCGYGRPGARSPPGSRPRHATSCSGARRSSSRSTPSSTSARVNSVVVFLPPPPGGEIAPRRRSSSAAAISAPQLAQPLTRDARPADAGRRRRSLARRPRR